MFRIKLKIFLLVLGLLMMDSLYSQTFSLGPYVGLNVSDVGIKTIDTTPISDAKFGYQIGLFTRVQIKPVFVQLEASYFYSRSAIEYKQNKIVPQSIDVGYLAFSGMLGLKLGTLRIQAGPFIHRDVIFLQNESIKDQISIEKDGVQNLFGVQAGIGVNIAKRWNIDFRYLKYFSPTNYVFKEASGELKIREASPSALAVHLGYAIIKK
jgi:hypothetical protein